MTFWLASIDERLSQGDVVAEVLMASAIHPSIGVKKETLSKGRIGWVETAEVTTSFVANGKTAYSLVISHSCDLDKNEAKGRVLVAPINLKGVAGPSWPSIEKFERRSLFPLPDVLDLGDMYADLRVIRAVDRDALGGRVASMSEAGLQMLHRHLHGFLIRGPERAVADQ